MNEGRNRAFEKIMDSTSKEDFIVPEESVRLENRLIKYRVRCVRFIVIFYDLEDRLYE